MDEITKEWRKFLLEERKVPYQIYCDMDGVLVDLEEGIIEALGMEEMEEEIRTAAVQVVKSGELWQDFKNEKKYPELNKGAKKIFELISKDANFWANLPLKNDAQQLWSYISSLSPSPYILSAPWDKESGKGKLLWLSKLAENLEPTPGRDKIILTHDKHLHAVNLETGRPNILVDDMDKYLEPWKKAGGIAIKHTQTSNTIKELGKLID